MNTRVAFMLIAALFLAVPGAAHAQTNIRGIPTWTSCTPYTDQNGATYWASYAFDGNVNTKWVAAVPAGGCIVDFYLGGYRSVAQVTVKHATAGADTWENMNTVAYTVSYLSGGAYYQAASVYNPTYEPVTTSYVDAFNAYTDHLRVWVTNPGGADNILRIPEIEVYLWGDTNPDPGTGRIGWPFSGHKDNRYSWVQTPADWLHMGDDVYAENWERSGFVTCGAPVYAPIAGNVIYAGINTAGNDTGNYGYQVVIRSTINRDYAFRVAHLQAGSLRVAAGDIVSVGQQLGNVGNTSNWPTCRAHIAVYKDITMVGPYGNRGLLNLRSGLPPSGIISGDPSLYAMPFKVNAPGRIANP